MLAKGFSKPTDRVERLRSMIVNAVPCIEAERAVLITESYKATEGLPMIMRRAKALENILNNLNDKKKLLLHSCCGPCSSYVISYLTKYFDITILYYNPKICLLHPQKYHFIFIIFLDSTIDIEFIIRRNILQTTKGAFSWKKILPQAAS